MLCPNCGKQNSDGVLFCESCGAFLSGESAATPAGNPEAKSAGNGVMDGLLGSIKNPKQTADGDFMTAGIFAGINFLAIFFFLWRYVGAFITKLADVGDVSVDEYIEKLEVEYSIFPMLVAALAITILGVAIYAGAVYLINLLSKKESDLMQLLIKGAVNTMIPSALLFVGTLLSFLAWWFFPLVMIAIIVVWIVNICAEVNDGENQLISAGVVSVVLVVMMLLTSLLASWGIGETTIRNKSYNELNEDSDSSICHIIFDALMTSED